MIEICAAAALIDGGEGVRFDLAWHGQKGTGFAVRFRGKVVAYLNQCSHVAMELDWLPGVFFEDQGEFLMCATHGAIYDPANGHCVGGPCLGRGGLRPLQVVERDGKVWWIPGDGYVPIAAPPTASS